MARVRREVWVGGKKGNNYGLDWPTPQTLPKKCPAATLTEQTKAGEKVFGETSERGNGGTERGRGRNCFWSLSRIISWGTGEPQSTG